MPKGARMMNEHSKVAIVTGAARPWGLGRSVATMLANKGMDIAVVDIRDDWGEEAAKSITAETGRRAVYVHTDIAQRASVEAMAKRVADEFGRIDVLVNSAAIVRNERLESMTEETFDQVININLRGTYLTCQAVVPTMRQQGSGRIVNVASGSAVQPLKGLGIYSASKAGVVAFSKVIAWELARYGIVVLTVAPGNMVTQMGADEGPTEGDFTDEFRASPFLRRLHPDEVADVIVYGATSASPVLAGQLLHANIGTYMV